MVQAWPAPVAWPVAAGQRKVYGVAFGLGVSLMRARAPRGTIEAESRMAEQRRTVPRGWRIVRYGLPRGHDGTAAPRDERTRWAVEHSGRRVVWGLHSAAAARRWLGHLTAPTQLRLVNPEVRARETVGSERRGARSYRTPPYWAA